MKKVILVIRDGWGYRADTTDNAIAEADTPVTDRIMEEYPNVLLAASGEAVGLPPGYQGNSEVGHMTIGSGRIIFQSLARINKSIKDGSFFRIQEFIDAIDNCKEHGSTLHLIGLLQVEGVHAHIDHLFALLDLCRQQDFKDVVIHVITDGRDAPVTDSEIHVESLLKKIQEIGFGKIATISGRYYTMDRDKRWDRTKKAYDCLVKGICKETFDEPMKLLAHCHANDETDEFIIPRKASWYEGIKPKDSIIFYNFRTDRPRQLTKAIVEKDFSGFDAEPLDVVYVGMTQYYRPMNAKVAFKDQSMDKLLGQVISDAGKKQLRISETEKYAHVTFFFNGQREEHFPGEDRILIQSPKVATYDLKPEMSVYEITEKLVAQIKTGEYEFIVTNLVNGDMVGHTGIRDAIIKGVESVDECLGKIIEAGLENDYVMLVFADHGNAEDQTPKWRTSHTINPVPFILVSDDPEIKGGKLKSGKGLQDIAPTVLSLMEIKVPLQMEGENIIS